MFDFIKNSLCIRYVRRLCEWCAIHASFQWLTGFFLSVSCRCCWCCCCYFACYLWCSVHHRVQPHTEWNTRFDFPAFIPCTVYTIKSCYRLCLFREAFVHDFDLFESWYEPRFDIFMNIFRTEKQNAKTKRMKFSVRFLLFERLCAFFLAFHFISIHFLVGA